MQSAHARPLVAIACGGTGGHLFPGLAVAEVLKTRGCDVTLLISPKEIDQQAVKSATGMQVVTLPAVAFSGGGFFRFLHGFWQSWRAAKNLFQARPPQAVLAMGGFTSAPPVLAGKAFGAATFLHESNTIPGKANRWLSRWVDGAFVYFPETAKRLRHASVTVTGMPVRSQFRPMDTKAARVKLGLDPERPVLLVMGGSQGARGVNILMLESLPHLTRLLPSLQFLHLCGSSDQAKVGQAYSRQQCHAVVHPFLTEMEFALGAATVAISRAGASSLAELAAMRLPAFLIPYPAAADNHQYYNALAFTESGAARMGEQRHISPEGLSQAIVELVGNPQARAAMASALAQWHFPNAAEQIAERMIQAIGFAGQSSCVPAGEQVKSGPGAQLLFQSIIP